MLSDSNDKKLNCIHLSSDDSCQENLNPKNKKVTFNNVRLCASGEYDIPFGFGIRFTLKRLNEDSSVVMCYDYYIMNNERNIIFIRRCPYNTCVRFAGPKTTRRVNGKIHLVSTVKCVINRQKKRGSVKNNENAKSRGRKNRNKNQSLTVLRRQVGCDFFVFV